MAIAEYRVRTVVPADHVKSMLGQCPSEAEYSVLITGDVRVVKPNGEVLLVYRTGVLSRELLDSSYPALHELKAQQTTNRGLASGTKRVRLYRGVRTYSKPISSAIVGAIEASQPYNFCRLTAWTGTETAKFSSLYPLFQAIGEQFKKEVPDRWQAQMAYVAKTKREWVVPGTPFTTITCNNTYSTGLHTDKGDLAQGFSNLVVLRRGSPFAGGQLVFPEYRIAVEMTEGSVLLMDAHAVHGNVPLRLADETSERISIVCYYRTKMKLCGDAEAEAARAQRVAGRRTQKEFAAP